MAAIVHGAASAITESCCEELCIAALVHGAASLVLAGSVGDLSFRLLSPLSGACGNGVPIHRI